MNTGDYLFGAFMGLVAFGPMLWREAYRRGYERGGQRAADLLYGGAPPAELFESKSPRTEPK